MERTQIIRLTEAFAAGTLRSVHTIGFWVSGSGDFYRRLKQGGDVTTGRASRIARKFSELWPASLPWPTDVPRPNPATGSLSAGGVKGRAIGTEPSVNPPPNSQKGGAAADPVVLVRAARGRRSAAIEAGDRAGAERAQHDAVTAAIRLGDNGEIASPNALCLALGLEERRYVYDDTVRRYRDGVGKSRRPRSGSACGKVLALLIAAGDTRFASRRPTAVAPELAAAVAGLRS